MTNFSLVTGSVAIELRQIPNQPIRFTVKLGYVTRSYKDIVELLSG